MSTQWDAAFEASPAGSDSPALGDNKITELKSAIRERVEKEHDLATSTGTFASHGWHKLGSAKVYYGTSAPTVRPDGSTALTSADAGRMWINSSTYAVQVYTGTAWVGVASNNLYTETITGSNTFAAFGTDSVITLSNASAAGVSIANGAALAGISLTLLKTTSTAVTLTTASGVTYSFTEGSLCLIWTGSSWILKGKQGQTLILTNGSSASWKAPFKGIYKVTVIGQGGRGGNAVMTGTGAAECLGGGGASAGWASKKYALTSGQVCTYTAGISATTPIASTFTDGTTLITGIQGVNGDDTSSSGSSNDIGVATNPLAYSSAFATADSYGLGRAGGAADNNPPYPSGIGAMADFGGVADAVNLSYAAPPYGVNGNAGKSYGGGGSGATFWGAGTGTATGGNCSYGAIIIEF
jgi:hypothetical protein